MSQALHHPRGTVHLDPATGGGLHVRVEMADASAYVAGAPWTTAYPPELIEAILQVKGPAWLCDELRRDEDPAYVENDIRHDILGFLPPEAFTGRELLDFGCGCGSSTSVLSRLLPGVRITGVELEKPALDIARRRVDRLGLDAELLLSPTPESLPSGIGRFDFIVFSAVFEHLLPVERTRLLPLVWSHLAPGGVLFLNQTPHRYFPVEGHTTGLPLINWLPDGMAHAATRSFCRRAARDADWRTLLRMGIRGGTPGEVLSILRATGDRPLPLKPVRDGLRDHLDLWDRSSRVRHAGAGHTAKVAMLRAVKALTGMTLVPNISMAVRKADGGPEAAA